MTDQAIAELSALDARLTQLEDRLEILNLRAGLAHSSDTTDQAFENHAYHDDCVMDRNDAADPIIGREAIVAIIGGQQHAKAIQAGMVHFAGLPLVRIEGDRAVATGYLQIVVPVEQGQRLALDRYGETAGVAVWRLTANRWELAKDSNGWRMTGRIIRSVPCAEIMQLMAPSLR